VEINVFNTSFQHFSVFHFKKFSLKTNPSVKIQSNSQNSKQSVKIQSHQTKFKVISQNSKLSVKIQSNQPKLKAIKPKFKASAKIQSNNTKFKAISKFSVPLFSLFQSLIPKNFAENKANQSFQPNLQRRHYKSAKIDVISQNSKQSAKIQSHQQKFKVISQSSCKICQIYSRKRRN
jgi:hypothetical protein